MVHGETSKYSSTRYSNYLEVSVLRQQLALKLCLEGQASLESIETSYLYDGEKCNMWTIVVGRRVLAPILFNPCEAPVFSSS